MVNATSTPHRGGLTFAHPGEPEPLMELFETCPDYRVSVWNLLLVHADTCQRISGKSTIEFVQRSTRIRLVVGTRVGADEVQSVVPKIGPRIDRSSEPRDRITIAVREKIRSSDNPIKYAEGRVTRAQILSPSPQAAAPPAVVRHWSTHWLFGRSRAQNWG